MESTRDARERPGKSRGVEMARSREKRNETFFSRTIGNVREVGEIGCYHIYVYIYISRGLCLRSSPLPSPSPEPGERTFGSISGTRCRKGSESIIDRHVDETIAIVFGFAEKNERRWGRVGCDKTPMGTSYILGQLGVIEQGTISNAK